jgi:glycerol-3-phosphate acyltransferase PlsX
MCIAVDAMGGDLGPEEVVRGVLQAACEKDEPVRFILVGDEKCIHSELQRHKDIPPLIDVQHASQIIEMNDKPREVYRKKPDASVVVAARLVKEGSADAFISIGNTGAAMAAAIFLLRPIPGIDRPAIATPMPSLGAPTLLLDGGANVDCVPHQLLEFGLMGQVYARHVLGVPDPKVGLLSNGAEPSKGNELTRQAHLLLKKHLPNFYGNIEGMDLFKGIVQVIVCDGFAGNVVLKVAEGVGETVMIMVKKELTRHSWMKLFLLPLRSAIQNLRHSVDYREFGGAPLLGVNGVCIVGHGRSDALAIASAIRVAKKSVKNNLVREIEHAAAVGLPRIQTTEVKEA